MVFCLLVLAAVAATAIPPGCDAPHRAVALIRLTGGQVLDAPPHSVPSADACKQRCCANTLCVGWTAGPCNTTTPAGHGGVESCCTLRSGATVPIRDFDAVTGWVARASADIPDTYGRVTSLGGVTAAERQWSGCESSLAALTSPASTRAARCARVVPALFRNDHGAGFTEHGSLAFPLFSARGVMPRRLPSADAKVDQTTALFYHYIESPNSSAPLLLWTNGGPGASSVFFGDFFQGMG